MVELKEAASFNTSAASEKTNTDENAIQDVEKAIPDDQDIAEVAADTKAEDDPNIVNWDGPDDPENPMNWSSNKKATAIGIISFITLLS